jgi:antitoxin component YwqK of YwqJK toxin-antitoxin module
MLDTFIVTGCVPKDTNMRHTWKLLAITLLGVAATNQLTNVTAQQPFETAQQPSEALVLPQEPISEPSVFKIPEAPITAIPSAVIRPIGPRTDFPISVAAQPQPTIKAFTAPIAPVNQTAQAAEPVDDQAPPVPHGYRRLTIKPVEPRINAESELPAAPMVEPSPMAAGPKPLPTASSPVEVEATLDIKAAVKPSIPESPTGELPIEIVRERYSNSQIKTERHVTQDTNGNYINHGSWVRFDERGRMVGGGDYKLGLREGKWTRWFAANEGPLFSGPLFKDFAAPFTSEATFVDDRLNGLWRVTDSKNRKVCEWNFENGVQNGKSYWYGPSGQVRRELPFQNGEIHGDVLEYGNDNKVVKKETFIDGRKLAVQTDWHEPNAKRAEGSTLLVKEVVKPHFDFWEGVATFTVVSREGQNQRHGTWSWWHKNGHKQMEGTFKFDQPAGHFAWWYSNGQKQLEGDYVDGKQDGKFVWWHPNGMKMMEGDYVAGVQVNEWKRWNEEGKVRELARYSSDGEQLELKQFGVANAGASEATKPEPKTSAIVPQVLPKVNGAPKNIAVKPTQQPVNNNSSRR